MFDKSQAKSLIGQTLFDRTGAKIGTIGQVYLDKVHDQPQWITVNTGMFGGNESFVPLAEASLLDGGVGVPYSKNTIKDAPNVENSGQLSEAQEQDLYEHYDVPYTTDGATFADTSRLAPVSSSGVRTDGKHVADQDAV